MKKFLRKRFYMGKLLFIAIMIIACMGIIIYYMTVRIAKYSREIEFLNKDLVNLKSEMTQKQKEIDQRELTLIEREKDLKEDRYVKFLQDEVQLYKNLVEILLYLINE